jgi:hypothetical protein
MFRNIFREKPIVCKRARDLPCYREGEGKPKVDGKRQSNATKKRGRTAIS